MLPLWAEIDWNSLLRQETFLMPVMLCTVVVVIGVVVAATVIATQWRKARQAEYESGLKSQMIERGFSAAEIERVLNAGLGENRDGKAANQANRRDAVACC